MFETIRRSNLSIYVFGEVIRYYIIDFWSAAKYIGLHDYVGYELCRLLHST